MNELTIRGRSAAEFVGMEPARGRVPQQRHFGKPVLAEYDIKLKTYREVLGAAEGMKEARPVGSASFNGSKAAGWVA